MNLPAFTAEASLYRSSNKYVCHTHQRTPPQVSPAAYDQSCLSGCLQDCGITCGGESGSSKAACLRQCSNENTDCKSGCYVPGNPATPLPPSTPTKFASRTRIAWECTKWHYGFTGRGFEGGDICDTPLQRCEYFEGACTGSPFFDPNAFHTRCVTAGGTTFCCNKWHEFPFIRVCPDGSVTPGCSFCPF